MDWELTLVLDPSVHEAMYLRVARAIKDDIRRGRLPAGTSLPGTRRLAAVLGIHRNTTVAAYREQTRGGRSARPSRRYPWPPRRARIAV